MNDVEKNQIYSELQTTSHIYFQTVEAGALPLFVKMMNYKDEDEQEAAAKTTWTLAFDKEVIRITFANYFILCHGYFNFDTNSMKISVSGARKHQK